MASLMLHALRPCHSPRQRCADHPACRSSLPTKLNGAETLALGQLDRIAALRRTLNAPLRAALSRQFRRVPRRSSVGIGPAFETDCELQVFAPKPLSFPYSRRCAFRCDRSAHIPECRWTKMLPHRGKSSCGRVASKTLSSCDQLLIGEATANRRAEQAGEPLHCVAAHAATLRRPERMSLTYACVVPKRAAISRWSILPLRLRISAICASVRSAL